MSKRLPKAQETALLRKHTTGDFGGQRWPTVKALFSAGMIEEVSKKIVVTARGKEYCDKHHMGISL